MTSQRSLGRLLQRFFNLVRPSSQSELPLQYLSVEIRVACARWKKVECVCVQ